MEKRQLGDSGIEVSKLCLGTMTWGEQNTLKQAHQQLDYALDHGINFIDTAELYPVPPQAKTCHRTEEYIGQWPRLKHQRDRMVIASKAVGPHFESSFGGPCVDWIRDGARLTRQHIFSAVENSLQRLKIDCIDLYQVHWPDRHTNFFGQRGFTQPPSPEQQTPIAESLCALNELIKQGKIRSFGLSNENPWGVAQWLKLADEGLGPRPVSIQNPYSLLNRLYEVGLAEFSYRENIGLLPYSPLAFGTLTGKYDNHQKPLGARLTLFNYFSRYTSEASQRASFAYNQLARDNHLSPAQMALAFATSRFFTTSTIIGATSIEQLAENISSANLNLCPQLLESIETIHDSNPNPAP